MIPKKIHYCWFGGQPLPNSVKKCIDSWKEYCPDYEIIQWDESNYDIHKNSYISEAYQVKKYAFVSDYVRLDVVYHHGGIYLDTDVEVIKPLDELLNEECYLGCELPGRVNTGIGFGAEKGHSFLKRNMDEYKNEHFLINGKINAKPCVEYTLKVLQLTSFKDIDITQKIDGLTIFSTEYFCPLNMVTRKLKVTKNTYSIHHYSATWYGDNKLKRISKKMTLPVKVILKRNLDAAFGVGTYHQWKEKLLLRKR